MGGHRQRKAKLQPAIPRGLDETGLYEAACCEFADQFGFGRGEICYWWGQITMARMKEGKQPQDVAEDGAWYDVRAAFDQRGREPS